MNFRAYPRLAAHWQILLALILATIVGLSLKLVGDSAALGPLRDGFLAVSGFVGDLFMRALKMLIVPLIVASVISGITGLQGVTGLGRLGAKTIALFLTTTALATVLGLTLVNLLKPGLENGQPNRVIREAFMAQAETAGEGDLAKVSTAAGREATDFLDIFRKMIPENVVQAASDNGQMLGVILFSLLLAIAVTQLPGEKTRGFREFVETAHEAMMVLTKWVMALAPLGIFGLMVPIIFKTGPELFVQMGTYFVTVLSGLMIHLFLVLPLVVRVFTGRNPLPLFREMRPALMLAFSTASSSGTLPVTMRCMQEGAGVSKRITSFTLPLGATINMDGTALYECVAVLFVAQVMGVEMGLAAQAFVVVASLLTSIGVAGIPSASLVAILLILKNSGIPEAESAVIALLAVDRLLDMSRTAVNVFSDSCTALIMAHMEGEKIFPKSGPRA
ncbi:MAG: dicarboxylate/amino acid:cation symporter [Verrucomicrobia bacterium]|nr:MAG: dicarboxylate/amino acid:cation symporter [Verrucomicrobiota bacterium]